MYINPILDRMLQGQDFTGAPSSFDTGTMRLLAQTYAATENLIAVVSDLQTERSVIAKGAVARVFGLTEGCEEIPSIWEREILSLIHPDDLDRKYVAETRFFHFVMNQPAEERRRYVMFNALRMRDREGNYRPVIHRLFYFHDATARVATHALCLFALAQDEVRPDCIADTLTGRSDPITLPASNLLTTRQQAILALAAEGLSSKAIADRLFISINTVNRHRQDIIQRLKVRNITEAVAMAKRF